MNKENTQQPQSKHDWVGKLPLYLVLVTAGGFAATLFLTSILRQKNSEYDNLANKYNNLVGSFNEAADMNQELNKTNNSLFKSDDALANSAFKSSNLAIELLSSKIPDSVSKVNDPALREKFYESFMQFGVDAQKYKTSVSEGATIKQVLSDVLVLVDRGNELLYNSEAVLGLQRDGIEPDPNKVKIGGISIGEGQELEPLYIK